MRQTAVDYLFEKLWATPKDKFTWQMILQEAKQMEKEQIFDAYQEGYLYFPPIENFEEYYKENYGKDA